MTNLAKALKNYYFKEGNKIIFGNKYTLNQLSLEMWVRLGYRGVDSSSISRVINGKRLFTLKQLDVLASTLRLNQANRSELMEALGADHMTRYGFQLSNSFKQCSGLIDVMKINLSHIDLIKGRESHIALDWYSELENKIEHDLLNETKSSLCRRELQKILGEILYEKGDLINYSLPAKKDYNLMKSLTKNIFQLAEKLQSTELKIKGHLLLGYSTFKLGGYVTASSTRKFYRSSARNIEKAGTLLSSLQETKYLDLICWRYMITASAYLNNYSLYKSAENNLLRMIDEKYKEDKSEYRLLSRFALARARSFFKESNIRTIDDIDKNSCSNPLREVVLLESKIETLKKLTKKEYAHIKNLSKRGLIISEKYSIKRFNNYFQEHLN